MTDGKPIDLLSDTEREGLRECGQPGWTSPMLATLTDARFSDPDWLFERKLDGLPLRARKELLRAAIDFDDPLRFARHRNRDGEAFYREACSKGREGLIAKDATSRYEHKRSRSWLKFKCTKSQELVIGGCTGPKSDRKGFGALLVGYYDELVYAGKVGTGYDDEFLCEFRSRLDRISRKTSPFPGEHPEDEAITWVTPKLVGEFGFTEWTRAGKLCHPRFLGLRRDKAARDVVRESPEPAS